MIVTDEKLERWKRADPVVMAAAKAMYVVKSSGRDPTIVWDELLGMSHQQIIVAHYVELAEVALAIFREHQQPAT